ncbi:DUF983 domain-containing protein [Thalassoglobus sp. JC818]|uniref:DUF983 domain-containing protein n=1 Tax=Thalassoglobus sp. JC818 TaxID=3232136 RepID=UPI0034584A12
MNQPSQPQQSDAEIPDGQETVQSKWPRPQFETLIWRAIRLRCPRCGQGHLFEGFIRMPERCSHCNLRIQREAGFYLGSTYVNYGLTAVLMTATFLFLRLVMNIPAKTMIWPLFGFCIIFPVLIFRQARAIWLALDCQFDQSILNEE